MDHSMKLYKVDFAQFTQILGYENFSASLTLTLLSNSQNVNKALNFF